MGLEDFDWVFFISVSEVLVVVEVNQVGRSIVLAIWATFWTISGKMPHFSTLEAGIGRVSYSSGVPLEVVLWVVSLISVGVLSSLEVIASVVSSVVSSGRRSIPVNIHWNWSVIHPSRGIRRVVLRCVLPLGAGVIPLWALLLRGECSEGSVSSEYVP